MPAKNTTKGSVPTLCTRKSSATGKPIAYYGQNGCLSFHRCRHCGARYCSR